MNIIESRLELFCKPTDLTE